MGYVSFVAANILTPQGNCGDEIPLGQEKPAKTEAKSPPMPSVFRRFIFCLNLVSEPRAVMACLGGQWKSILAKDSPRLSATDEHQVERS
jgi:hypothetical protein